MAGRRENERNISMKNEQTMIIGGKRFTFGQHTYVCGILNVTPDSFSDGGKFNSLDRALFHVQKMVEDGADMIDVGGESTRPGHEKISDQEEISRVVPVIEALRRRFDIPLSLDTYKSAVAQEGLRAGAGLLNDIWGLADDEKLGKIVADANVAYCLMHNRRHPKPHLTPRRLVLELEEDIKRACSCGIAPDKIILDPGIGFAKTQEENLMVMANLDRLQQMGYPVLLGASRKSCIDYVLHLPTDQRLEGTLATTAFAVREHLAFVRVHDVKEHVRFIRMMEAIESHRKEQ